MGDGEPQQKVFLSYARSDREQVARLASALQAAGLDVWWDTLIEGGAAFARSIEASLEKCDAVIACWSRASVSSDWVLDEAGRGRDLRKLVPVTLDGTEPPMGFRQYHAVDLSRWRGDRDSGEIAALLRGIAAAAGRPAPAPPPTTGRRAGFSRRRMLALAAGAAGVAGAGLAAWWFGPFRRDARGLASVAVLPFVNLSGIPEQDYFSDGLSEELRATLARNL